MHCNSFCLLALVFVFSASSQAALVMDSMTFSGRADQSIRVPAGSPLTGAPFNAPPGAVFDLSALGTISLGWESDGDADNSVAMTSFSADFAQVHPQLGPYSLAAVGTGPGSGFSGTLDNIVESGGQLVSADWTLNTTFSLTLAGGAATIYTKDQATFTGTVRGGAAILGEIFTSTGDIEGFLSLGDINTDPLAAVSFNRTVTAVPEPSSLACLLAASVLPLRMRRRRTRS